LKQHSGSIGRYVVGEVVHGSDGGDGEVHRDVIGLEGGGKRRDDQLGHRGMGIDKEEQERHVQPMS
jgi:hypothetical protein